MKRIPILLCVTAALAAMAAQAQSTLYKWVDKDGKVQYTEFPPPKDARDVSEKSMRGTGSAAGLAADVSTAITTRCKGRHIVGGECPHAPQPPMGFA